MGGLDAIVFTGGIGQNNAALRQEALSGLEFLGVRLDEEKNAKGEAGSLISSAISPVRVYLVVTNEEIIIARKAQALLTE